MTTIVTGGAADPPFVGDAVTTDVKISVVGAAEDAVFVMITVLGAACEVCDRISDDTDDAMEEETDAGTVEDSVSETCEEVDDCVVDVTVESIGSVWGG